MERFYQDLSRTVKQVHKRDVLLVMGDFNAKVGKSKPSAMSSAVGLYGLKETNEAGEQLEDFCLEHKLALANTVFKQHPRWLYTWTSPDDDIRNHIRLYFNCTKMENKLEELSRISRSRLRHRSSISCSWRRWKSGWLTDKNSTALRLWILRNLRKRKQYSLQQQVYDICESQPSDPVWGSIRRCDRLLHSYTFRLCACRSRERSWGVTVYTRLCET